jgi:hypothetical protein
MNKSLSKAVNKVQKEADKAQAMANTTIQKGSHRKGFETVKSGTPLDHTVKHNPADLTGVKFGMSKGITKNMDNYESLRVDVWLTSETREGETEKEAFARVEALIDEVLEESVLATIEANQ